MTDRPKDGGAPRTSKAKAAAVQEAKASVHEAIGKLIGDDAARDRGSAGKRAGAATGRKKSGAS